MSRMRLAGLLLIGVAACSTPSPNRQSAARSTASREAPTTTSQSKPATTTRPTTTSKRTARRTTAAHRDTVQNTVNPLTNH